MAGIAAHVYIYTNVKQPGKITLQEPTKNVGTAETGKKVRFFFNAAKRAIRMGGKTLTIIGIFFFVGGWMVENLFGIQFLCQGTHGMFCRILFISRLLMYICNEECQEKISPIQSYFNILDNSF